MVKKASKSGSKGAAEKPQWASTSILPQTDNNMSTMKGSKLEEAKLLFDSDVFVVIPEAKVGADWYAKYWVCFYFYPFKIGMRFSFSKLTQDLLTLLKVSPAQLMPTTWRVLACLDAIEEKHELGIDVNVIMHSYATKKFGNCRYGLTAKKNDELLVLNLEVVNDRGWKNYFFFAKKSSLGEDGAYLRDKWNADGKNPITC